jgi:hypothetical protein
LYCNRKTICMNPLATCLRVCITCHSVFSTYDLLFIQYRVRKSSTFLPLVYGLVAVATSLACAVAVHQSKCHFILRHTSPATGLLLCYSVTDLPSSLCLDFTIDPPHMHASADGGIPNAELPHCFRITGPQIKVNCLLRLFANGLRRG